MKPRRIIAPIFWALCCLVFAIPATAHAQASPSHAAPTTAVGWLGVEMARKNDTGVTGVKIRRHVPDSPAEKAGIAHGDVVQTIDGIAVQHAEDMVQLLGKKKAGSTVKLRLGGPNARTVSVVLGTHPKHLTDIGKRLVGRPAPSAKAMALESGKMEDVAPRDGKVRIIEFWATWCGPCRHIQPSVVRWVDALKGPNFEYVAVAEDDAPTVQSYLKKNPVNYRVLADADSTAELVYWGMATPTFVLIDQGGKVVQYGSGTATTRSIFEHARRLLHKSSP